MHRESRWLFSQTHFLVKRVAQKAQGENARSTAAPRRPPLASWPRPPRRARAAAGSRGPESARGSGDIAHPAERRATCCRPSPWAGSEWGGRSVFVVCHFRRLARFRGRRLGMGSVPPCESLPALPKACEIAAASRAPIGRGAHPQEDKSPTRRVVILLAPGAEFLAVTARTAGVFPCAIRPNAGFPAIAAAPAT
jgi:hypothetical protein